MSEITAVSLFTGAGGMDIGSAGNPHTCTARITLAVTPVMRKSPYAGMIFNGLGRPLNLDGVSATLPASMGG